MAKHSPRIPAAERFKVVECPYGELALHLSAYEINENQRLWGKYADKCATYMITYHNGVMIRAEPLYHEDVIHMLKQAYLMGYWDGHGEHLSGVEPDPAPPATERVRA